MIYRFQQIIKKHFLFIGFIFFYLVLIGTKLTLSPKPFFDWDESLYAQTGREMFRQNYFLFPLWQGQIWLDKPPLVSFVYGAIPRILFFMAPEVSTRLFTLTISIVVLVFVYKLYLSVIKNAFAASIICLLTAFTPIYLQRSQVLNQDIFLLLGWLGYLFFYRRFYLSLFFLAVAVFSKSLVGFFPIPIFALFFIYEHFTKELGRQKLIDHLKRLSLHAAILLMWYAVMLIIYKQQFWQLHIIESHFRRVTASIESHFGARTFYLDLVVSQFGPLATFSMIVGLIWLGYRFFVTKKISARQLLFALFLFPWFIFLNLTKTKIFWYLLPVVPQLAFLAVAPLQIFQNKKLLYYPLLFCVATGIFYAAVVKNKIQNTNYWGYGDHYYLSLYAKDKCDQMTVLMDPNTRQTYATLKKMNLVITTTHWWGNHPSMVYYFAKPINFIYDVNEMPMILATRKPLDCLAIDSFDKEVLSNTNLSKLNQFGSYLLYR